MKKIILTFAIVLGLTAWSDVLIAQCVGNANPTNELGIKVVSFRNNSQLFGINDPSKVFHPELLKGIHYKRYFINSAFRASFSYSNFETSESPANCADCFSYSGKGRGGSLRLGYEYFGILGTFEPYAGIDMVINYGTFSGTSSGGIAGQTYIDDRTRTGVGLAPTIGLRYFLAYSFSISAETALDAMFISTKVIQENTDPQSSTNLGRTETFEPGFWYHPVSSLSFNVLF